MLEKSLLILGAICILVGTYYLSKSVFLSTVASRYWLRGRDGITLKWKIAGMIFGLNEGNWTLAFTGDDQLTPAQIRRVRDPFAPIRGFALIVVGTIFQIIAIILS